MLQFVMWSDTEEGLLVFRCSFILLSKGHFLAKGRNVWFLEWNMSRECANVVRPILESHGLVVMLIRLCRINQILLYADRSTSHLPPHKQAYRKTINLVSWFIVYGSNRRFMQEITLFLMKPSVYLLYIYCK